MRPQCMMGQAGSVFEIGSWSSALTAVCRSLLAARTRFEHGYFCSGAPLNGTNAGGSDRYRWLILCGGQF
ncbi:hypothetical protein ROHU_029846 [Labeo rohita]|uniref:Uncharacterized protein n=1 Tax=Labeo rohita TaxID=84645 RepID=A0A498M3T7_LABRO|nr:hypothetical protein ROHU_029846 [Labeo rohita]